MNWAIAISISTIIAIISLLWSMANTVIGRYVATKITGNDLVHLTADVKELKKDDKEYRTELKKELHQINLSINRIEKRITKREAICETRHDLKK